MAKYDVIDQTRRGISSTEKCAGEVDILIEEDGSPVTIIEALNLDSLNTHYLDRTYRQNLQIRYCWEICLT